MTSRMILKLYPRSGEWCTDRELYRCSNAAKVMDKLPKGKKDYGKS